MARFAFRRVFQLMCAAGLLSTSTHVMASAFQIWEQDGASVGNYHAGRAALANDASTAYYNPAGITRIKNQQLVLSDVGILSSIKYRGTVSTNTYLAGMPQNVVTQGGSFTQVPDFHYVAPINSRIGFGLSLAAPFGLRTDYGRTSALRYAATTTQMQVVDLSPSLGIAITPALSTGFALDVERMSAEFDQLATTGPGSDTTSTNKGFDIAYGFHLGALYQFQPTTRVGLIYNSQVVHHFRGTSKLVGPISNAYISDGLATPASFVSQYTNASITLPPFTTLGGFHQLNNQWAIMATAIYTQWSVVQTISLKDVAGIDTDFMPSTALTVNLPQNYRNTWNVSVGTDFYATDKITLRAGLGYDQTPVRERYRTVEIPDSNRYAVALGGHYQAMKTLGLDVGWTHLLMAGTAHIAPPLQVSGAQATATNGRVNASADVFGAQLTWDIV